MPQLEITGEVFQAGVGWMEGGREGGKEGGREGGGFLAA